MLPPPFNVHFPNPKIDREVMQVTGGWQQPICLYLSVSLAVPVIHGRIGDPSNYCSAKVGGTPMKPHTISIGMTTPGESTMAEKGKQQVQTLLRMLRMLISC